MVEFPLVITLALGLLHFSQIVQPTDHVVLLVGHPVSLRSLRKGAIFAGKGMISSLQYSKCGRWKKQNLSRPSILISNIIVDWEESNKNNKD
jgi:hypothetical protein